MAQCFSVRTPSGTSPVVTGPPLRLSLPPGEHQVAAEYEMDGSRRWVVQTITVEPGQSAVLDFAEAIDQNMKKLQETAESKPVPRRMSPPAPTTPNRPSKPQPSTPGKQLLRHNSDSPNGSG
jgi:hypothetical protein